MDSSIDESYLAGQSGASMFRLNDENTRVLINEDYMQITPSSAARCVQFSENQLGIATGLENSLTIDDGSRGSHIFDQHQDGNPLTGLHGSSVQIAGSDAGLSVLFPDSGRPNLTSAIDMNAPECCLDIRGTVMGQGGISDCLASPNHLIDYGIVKTSEAMDMSLARAGMATGQDIYIKNGSISSSPIELLRTDSLLGLNLNNDRYLSTDLTGIRSVFGDDSNSCVLDTLNRSVCSINWDTMTQGYFGTEIDSFRIQDQFVNLTNEYNGALDSGIPSDTVFRATQNYVADTSFIAVSATSIEEDRVQIIQRFHEIDEAEEVSHLLRSTNPGFVAMYEGALGALYSGNRDRVRHFSVSFRELFTHIIHTVAPDEEIGAWSSDESLYHNGRPTRKARLKYITRGLDSPNFHRYLDATINATDEFLGLFQRGTHAVDSGYTESQLDAMRIQAEATIKLILSTSETT